MTLIDEARAIELYDLMGPGIEASGGSAGNTMVGIASLGGSASYIGKVYDDTLGMVFAHDMRASGVSYDVPPAPEGPPTGRSLILVTPDAQRTMNTYLGISSQLEPNDVDPETVAAARLLFCEGYIWDMPDAKQAIRKAIEVSLAAGGRVALTLSDTFCVDRHHAEFLDLIAGPVEVLFANRAELARLYESDDLDASVARLGTEVGLGCVTLGKHGSLLVSGSDVVQIDEFEVGKVVDTTGAGDQYAAGVLFGLSRGLPLKECGRLGSLAAAEVISHVGPRPQVSLKELAGL